MVDTIKFTHKTYKILLRYIEETKRENKMKAKYYLYIAWIVCLAIRTNTAKFHCSEIILPIKIQNLLNGIKM